MTTETNTTQNDFTWIPLIPLIGGFPLGIEKAWGKEPEFIASYEGIGNDNHYANYKNNLSFKKYDSADLEFEQKINLVVCTPPCAALSSLNTSKNPEKQGHTGKQNDFMYDCIKTAASKFQADIIAIENAPALATKKGAKVAENLRNLAKEFGYSTMLYKTSTHFHGLPQRRDRTFALFFREGNVPLFEYEKKPFVEFQQYLESMENNVVNDETVVNRKLLTQDPYYAYLKATHGDVRKLLHDAKQVTCLNYVKNNGLVDEVVAYTKEHGTDRHKHIMEHAVSKFAAGLGVWDSSVHIFNEYMNAVIGRNLNDTLHPSEDRSLTYLEALYMMGFPEDFELLHGRKSINHIAQNVSVHSAGFIGEQSLKYLRGELQESEYDYLKIDNWNDKLEPRSEGKAVSNLDDVFTA